MPDRIDLIAQATLSNMARMRGDGKPDPIAALTAALRGVKDDTVDEVVVVLIGRLNYHRRMLREAKGDLRRKHAQTRGELDMIIPMINAMKGRP